MKLLSDFSGAGGVDSAFDASMFGPDGSERLNLSGRGFFCGRDGSVGAVSNDFAAASIVLDCAGQAMWDRAARGDGPSVLSARVVFAGERPDTGHFGTVDVRSGQFSYTGARGFGATRPLTKADQVRVIAPV